jgi:hypothetical protein
MAFTPYGPFEWSGSGRNMMARIRLVEPAEARGRTAMNFTTAHTEIVDALAIDADAWLERPT